jgi:carbonic anhydrase
MSEQLSRRRFLTTSGLGVATAMVAPGTAGAPATDSAGAARTSPRRALKMLIDGNRRWVTGNVTHPHQSVARRVALRHVQHPFATAFSCIEAHGA